jgi:hypothetical protein
MLRTSSEHRTDGYFATLVLWSAAVLALSFGVILATYSLLTIGLRLVG